MNSKTLKYFQPKNRPPKLVQTTHYQTKTAKALVVLQDPETTLNETIQSKAIPPETKPGG